jgi:hypothetical protein
MGPQAVERIVKAELFKAAAVPAISCRSAGRADQSNATAPAMCGVAMDVPLMLI